MDIGKKIVGGKQTDQECITVMVSQKVPLQALSQEDMVPREIEGAVQILDATINVQYGEGKIATFTGQPVAGPMSEPGDSGSLVVDLENRAVGLLFAGSDLSTIFNLIKDVVSLLDFDFS